MNRKEHRSVIEPLEGRMLFSVAPGLQGYEGQPGNQGGAVHNP